MTVNAVLARDINVIQGIVLLIAAVYALVNLLVDLAYGVIDPRTRRSARAAGKATTSETTEVAA
jgi:peptide/nickel transport system permease protein